MKEFKCKFCGETTPNLFYKHERSICKKCRSSINKETYKEKTLVEKTTYKETQKSWQRSNLIRYRFLSARFSGIIKNLLCLFLVNAGLVGGVPQGQAHGAKTQQADFAVEVIIGGRVIAADTVFHTSYAPYSGFAR